MPSPTPSAILFPRASFSLAGLSVRSAVFVASSPSKGVLVDVTVVGGLVTSGGLPLGVVSGPVSIGLDDAVDDALGEIYR
jgi:hypothetical protein